MIYRATIRILGVPTIFFLRYAVIGTVLLGRMLYAYNS